jgi:choline dehydrogenase-like flavoprotein
MWSGVRFQTREQVDFVVIGSGAAGGVIARELSTAGFRVVVLEQGPYLRASDFRHDEVGYILNNELSGSPKDFPQTFRRTEQEEAKPVAFPAPPPILYARIVGGSSVHFTANYWRFRPIDFIERSTLGAIPGTGFADWPITYEELEPYYTKVEWEVGVSGVPGPFDPHRSKPYPMPPVPVKSSGVLFERGAQKLGLHPYPAPLAILSRPYNNRSRCISCGFCMGFGCEVGAKSSSLAAMIPLAEATGRCEIRPLSTVYRIETDASGRVTEVQYFDQHGAPQAQRAKAVVLSANGAESARLLLLSASSRFPQGLANASGMVGKHLMFNGYTTAMGLFEHQLNEYKSVQATRVALDYYDSDPARGFYGGGGLDARFDVNYPVVFSLGALPPDAPQWGGAYKRLLAQYYTRTMVVAGHSTTIPLETNNITLDPTLKDTFGRPVLRTTYKEHPDDLKTMQFFQDRCKEVLGAAGATRVWAAPVQEATLGVHLLGTCRMGTDPAMSVVDKYHRAHDVPNLFICDGSSVVTSGRGQPTMTIQALAFRAADHIIQFAKRGEI